MRIKVAKDEEERMRKLNRFFDVTCDDLEERILKARRRDKIEKVDELWHETRRRKWPRWRMIRAFEGEL